MFENRGGLFRSRSDVLPHIFGTVSDDPVPEDGDEKTRASLRMIESMPWGGHVAILNSADDSGARLALLADWADEESPLKTDSFIEAFVALADNQVQFTVFDQESSFAYERLDGD